MNPSELVPLKLLIRGFWKVRALNTHLWRRAFVWSGAAGKQSQPVRSATGSLLAQRVTEAGQIVGGDQPRVPVLAAGHPYLGTSVDLCADVHVGILGTQITQSPHVGLALVIISGRHDVNHTVRYIAMDSIACLLAGQLCLTVIRMFDPASQVPLYVQIANHVEAQIASGELAPGGRLPAERDLAEQWGVAYQTVRRAMRELRERGLVASVVGKGTFVREAGDR
jgi:GntR family transcriptional regulator